MTATFTMKASKGGDGGGFAKAPAGNHPAVLVAIIDMGTQENDYQGQKKWQRKAYFVWELVAEKVDGVARNHVVAIDLTLSLTEKSKLRKWIEARVGKPMPNDSDYDIIKELGQPCLLNVVEKNGYPKIEGVSAVPKGMTISKPGYTPIAWTLDDKESDIPSWVPYFYGKPILDQIKESREFRQATGETGATSGHDTGDNTPF